MRQIAILLLFAGATGTWATVREFSLAPKQIRWEIAAGETVSALAYNGQIPGPEIRVREGDTVRVKVHNGLKAPTTVHWHGVNVPYRMDGFPGVTQAPILPDSDFVYEFVARPAGNRYYHSHVDEPHQFTNALHGAFTIEPARQPRPPDRHYTVFITEWHTTPFTDPALVLAFNYFTMNGKSFPATADLKVRQGERVRITLVNVGALYHPFHLHGHQFKVAAFDGNEIPPEQQVARNVMPLLPGESADIEFLADNPGVWGLHCHMPYHMLNDFTHSPGGLLSLVVYEGFEKEAAAAHAKAPSAGGM